jgi:hypothetical protein
MLNFSSLKNPLNRADSESSRVLYTMLKDPPAKVAPLRNDKGVSSQSFWYL